ncbi:MAG: sialidase [Bacteroidota bacterium]
MKNSQAPSLFSSFVLILLFVLSYPKESTAQFMTKEALSQLTYRHIGPVGNRLISVAGIPGDPMVYYGGAASGGIWKTVDGGLTWKPVFDDKPVHAIGSLVISSSDSEIIWAGTGETFIRSNVSIGNGVWKSMDGGDHWAHMGLDKTGRIGRMIVHPDNPDIVYAAAVGHAYAPQQERGIYRTKDGGKSWEQVLFVNDSTGASDLVMDPNNPRILFAGMWQLDIKTWGRESGGPGSGIYMSRDGGDSWKKLEGNGLPSRPVGKIALAMSQANSDRIYALIETGDGVPWHGKKTDSGELWRSDDGGKKWTLMTHNRDLSGRQPYYTRCAVSPLDEDNVYFLAAAYSITQDGGKTFETAKGPAVPNWDHHDMWIDPMNENRMIVAGDGGLAISQNRGKSWLRSQLPVAQLYHVTTDNHVPYHVYTNRQDGPSLRGPSNSRTAGMFGPGGISRGMWHDVGGGESGFATPDPTDPDIIWSSTSGRGPLGGIVVRYNEKTRQYRQVEVWPEFTAGHAAKDVKYRFQWTFPLLISPHDHQTVYVCSQHVHRTTNGGQSWEEVSPDLSLNDVSKLGVSGGLTPDNIGVEYGSVIYALDESPVQQGVLWAGTNDGLVHISKDGGVSWTNVSENIPDLPPFGTVRNIDASKWEAGKAYLTVDFHQVGNFDPYVYKTTDFGQSWTKIIEGIMESPLSYCRNVREDPVRKGLLYLGTENALYVSFNDGQSWQSFMSNLPHTPMYWIDIQEHFNDLVLGTYGRGIWILDDLSPLQQWTEDIAASSAHLFSPRPAYRFRPISTPMDMMDDPSAGENPPAGAILNYWLAEADSAIIHIIDANQDTIRTLRQAGKAGFNRLVWDFMGSPSSQIKMRTSPRYADWVPLGKNRIRKVPPRIAVMAPPGNYTVYMQSGDKTFSQALTIIKDPHSEGSQADITAQTAMMKGIHVDLNRVVRLINQIELIRRQLYDLRAIAQEQDVPSELLSEFSRLDEAFLEIEEDLYNINLTGTGQDVIRWPARLAWKLEYLASTVAVADFPPTDQQYAVHQRIKKQIGEQENHLDQLIKKELPTFHQLLKEHQLDSPIISAFR